MVDIFHTKHCIRVPHPFCRNRWSQQLFKAGSVGPAFPTDGPVGEFPIKEHAPVFAQTEYFAKAAVIGVRRPIAIAPGGRAHVSPFAAERSPSTLSRADYRIEQPQRINETLVTPQA